MSSITFPLLADGDVIGVMGLDIRLGPLQAMISQVDGALYGGQGHVSLISESGVIVAWEQASNRIGQQFGSSDILPTELTAWLAQGTEQIVWTQDQQWLYVYMPVSLGQSSWGVVIQLPVDQVLADAINLDTAIEQQRNESVYVQLLASAIIAVVGFVVVLLAAARLVAPIKRVVASLKDIASGEGDLTQRLPVAQNDEVGELAMWFNRFLDKLQNTIREVVTAVDQVGDTASEAAQVARHSRDGSQSQ
ncbi:HAMP domain-containing protein, partial [Photobacterium sanctipauli]|uniref:HAMP domain-containing protein n=1 Tax=Photobacterium sanctipauli TaxID=1342794 RepID=UPI001363E5F0